MLEVFICVCTVIMVYNYDSCFERLILVSCASLLLFLFVCCAGVLANDTGKVCYDQLICEEECCHDLDFGIPYCCSKYTGFIYLGLMVGGGVIIAVLVIACYVFMKRTERELEAAAKLEAAKALNNARNSSTVDLSSETDQTGCTDPASDEVQISDLNNPPPAYSEVMRTFTRCMSCDVTRTASTPGSTLEAVNTLARQYSEGSHGPFQGLPPLVDVAALIARHRREHARGPQQQERGLPPLMSQPSLDNKLPSYEECTSQQMEISARTRMYPTNSNMFRGHKVSHEILRSIGNASVGEDELSTRLRNENDSQEQNKEMAEDETCFVNINETLEAVNGEFIEVHSDTKANSDHNQHTTHTASGRGEHHRNAVLESRYATIGHCIACKEEGIGHVASLTHYVDRAKIHRWQMTSDVMSQDQSEATVIRMTDMAPHCSSHTKEEENIGIAGSCDEPSVPRDLHTNNDTCFNQHIKREAPPEEHNETVITNPVDMSQSRSATTDCSSEGEASSGNLNVAEDSKDRCPESVNTTYSVHVEAEGMATTVQATGVITVQTASEDVSVRKDSSPDAVPSCEKC